MPTPLATYRVQLQPAFGFAAACGIVDYLADLGVSHLYASPYLQAVAGSTHGYDVVDPRRVNTELGGRAGHDELVRALRARGMGQVLDIVPNHMAIGGAANPWWWDVLENGRSSRYAGHFDVDWDPPESRLRDQVLLPVLGDHYGRVLEAGELSLARDAGRFNVRYDEQAFPVAPRSLDGLLAAAAVRAGSDELAFIADAFARLPPSTATDRISVGVRHRDKEVLAAQLTRLLDVQPELAEAVDAELARLNGDVDALDTLLQRQNYRLAFWRTAGRELDYRRFFDVTSLVGLRVEDERVFDETHELVLRWIADGLLDGLRIDHPDGMRDPATYLERLRARAPDSWIVVEKILEPGERLRDWPVAGTTGYDFMNEAIGLFVDPAGEEPLTRILRDFAGVTAELPDVVREDKHLVMRETFGSEVNRLTGLFLDVCERHRRHRDHTRHELHELIREVAACFPVYRSYVRADTGMVTEEDRDLVDRAIERARERRPDLEADLLEFLRAILTLEVRGEPEAELVMRFQQLTGAVMAKGVEDTTFYAYPRLLALNEVGGDPARFGVSVAAFHEAARERHERWPEAMLATSTHDTKRAEDVRARLALLSEIPEEWGLAGERWRALNERHRSGDLPDRGIEYLVYQTLVGAWPLDVERAVAYAEKAAREAKTHTSWTAPDATYEAALREFVEAILADDVFTLDLARFAGRLVAPGRVASLAQTLLKLTAPGVPDIYQGTELWDLSLVDPDNRRPVDFGRRRRLLDRALALDPAEGDAAERVCAGMEDGLPKLWTILQGLRLRRRLPEAFGAGPAGAYEPLVAVGEAADHVVAFARGGAVVAVVPRLVVRREAEGGWRSTSVRLPEGEWHNELTGELLDGREPTVASLLRRFPVALLAASEASGRAGGRDRRASGGAGAEGDRGGNGRTEA